MLNREQFPTFGATRQYIRQGVVFITGSLVVLGGQAINSTIPKPAPSGAALNYRETVT